jgi:hypothetical protein
LELRLIVESHTAAEDVLEAWAWEVSQKLEIGQVLLCKPALLMARKGTAVHRSSRDCYLFRN